MAGTETPSNRKSTFPRGCIERRPSTYCGPWTLGANPLNGKTCHGGGVGWFSKARAPDLTQEIVSRHLDADFTIYPLGEGRPSEKEVRAVGDDLGVRFPEGFVAHVCGWLPGCCILAREEVWPRPKPYDVGPFWTFLYGLHTFTPLRESADWMRLDVAGRQFQAQTGLAAAPILKVECDANVFCVDKGGSLLAYDHEENSLTSVGTDFWELFEREISELVARKNQLIREHREPAP